MPQPTPRQRRQWMAWYFAHAQDVTATCHQFGISRSTLGSDIHVMLALYSCFGQIVVANEILDGADMIGEGLGKRPCTAYQT